MTQLSNIKRLYVMVFQLSILLTLMILTPKAYANTENYLTQPLLMEASTVQPTPIIAEIGPFFGGGSFSKSEEIKSTSGFQLVVKKSYKINRLFSAAPRLELINSFISSNKKTAASNSIASYDNRSYGVGAEISSKPVKASNWNLYTGISLGQGTSKLDIKNSTDRSFSQFKTSGIPASYRSVEVGSHIDFVGSNLGVNLALVNTVYSLDQSRIAGSVKKEERPTDHGGILLSEESITADQLGLDKTMKQNTISLRVALSMGL